MDYLQQYLEHADSIHELQRQLKQRNLHFQPSVLVRFFYKSGHQPEQALAMLKRYYRHQHSLAKQMIWCNEMDRIASWGWFYFSGVRDALGRPVGILNVAKYKKPQTVEERQLVHQYILWQLEMAQALMRPPHMQTVIVVNAGAAGWTHVDLELGRHLIDMLKSFYPDTVGRVLILEMSWVLRGAWSMITNVLPPEAHGRIVFLANRDELWSHLPREQLEPDLTKTEFDARVYGEQIIMSVRQRQHGPDPLISLINTHLASVSSGTPGKLTADEELELNGIHVTVSPYSTMTMNTDLTADSEEEFWDCVESMSEEEDQIEKESHAASLISNVKELVRRPVELLQTVYFRSSHFVSVLLKHILGSRWRGSWLIVIALFVFFVGRRRYRGSADRR